MKAAIYQELVALQRAQPDGVLRAETVVEYAQDPASALHAQFEWDDSKAAKQHRLHQARALLRIAVVTLPTIDEPCRAFVSIRDERRPGRGGYRPIEDVLTDEWRRARFLEQARDDLVRLQAKYRVLVALVPRFAQAMAEVVAAVSPTVAPRAEPEGPAAP